MHPILFQLPGFTFYTQTILMIAAFIAGLVVAAHEGKQFAISRLDLTDVVLWGFIAALGGARLLFMVFQRNFFSFSLGDVCTLGTEGGFAFHGGLFAGGVAALVVAHYHHLNVWRVADALAPGLAIAMFFMRLGCLLNGCDYGVMTTAPWGIPLHGGPRHPIQVYEGLGNLMLLPLLSALNRKPLEPGRTFLLYLLCSALLRFGVDFYREDFARTGALFTIPQLIALGIALSAGFCLLLKAIKK